MKILLVAHFFPPDRFAGAEKRTFGYASELIQFGNHVQVVCAGAWDSGERHWNGFTDEIYQNIPVRRVHLNWAKSENPNQSLYDNSMVEEEFLQWLDEWQPDVIHIISLITLGVGVVRAAKKHKIPVVFTLTDFWLVCPKISLVKGDGSFCDGKVTENDCLQCMLWNSTVTRLIPKAVSSKVLFLLARTPWLSRLRGLRGMTLNIADRRHVLQDIALQFDCVTAPSTNLAHLIETNIKFSAPIRVLYSGHDLSWLKDNPDSRSSSVVRLGFIGQLIPVKGIDLLIKAFLSIEKQENASLWIFGDEEQNPAFSSSLKSMAEKNMNIHFEGRFEHRELGRVLDRIDVLVVPSQWHENNPRVIQEAFAAKVPVIASNVGGISEFVQHEVNGLLFDHDSVEDLSIQLYRVLNEPVLIERLRSGIKPVKTTEEEIAEINEIYQSLLVRRKE